MQFYFSVFDEHVRRSKVGGGNSREMDFESFLDFVLALENKDTPEGLTYLFRCLDLNGRGFLTTADIHTLFRYVWDILYYELCSLCGGGSYFFYSYFGVNLPIFCSWQPPSFSTSLCHSYSI